LHLRALDKMREAVRSSTRFMVADFLIGLILPSNA
jgi:hypothetical protein